MDESESVADWGEQWLREWIDEAGSDKQERDNREWLAKGWQSLTLDRAVAGDWWHQHRGFDRSATVSRTNSELLLYVHERHALPVWRAFLQLRSEAEPIPEVILAKLEQWGRRLLELAHRSESGKLPPDGELARFETHVGPLAADDDTATLQALELTGTRRGHVSFKRLRGTETRRRVATEIDHLRRAGWQWKRIAERLGITVIAAKERYYEFVPPKPRRKELGSLRGLEDAVRDMVRVGK
jgi:hypothetical protein